MSTNPAYEEFAETIASCVHRRMNLEEPYTTASGETKAMITVDRG